MGLWSKLKTIFIILRKADKIEEYSQIIETQEALIEMQEKIELLKGENQELKEKLRNKETLDFRNGAYWQKESGDGPFCPLCWDKEKDLIRLAYTNSSYSRCPACDNSFNVEISR